jgi:RNA polymerase sigma factor (sigma-70 family)
LSGPQQAQVEALFLKYGKGVGSYCLARLGNAELAEEITSRVFVAVVRHFGDVRGSAAGWLWSIVRSELTNHYRARPSGSQAIETLPCAAKSPVEHAENQELQRQLHYALQQISEAEQQIIYMKFFQDMPNHEIADAAGLSPSHVGVIVFRALKRLRQLMESSPRSTNVLAIKQAAERSRATVQELRL